MEGVWQDRGGEMRSRKEIEKGIPAFNKTVLNEDVLQDAILEVLLDIRDLMLKQEERERSLFVV